MSKFPGGACPQTPLEVLGFSSNSGFAIVQPPPKSKCLDPPLFMISVMRNDVEHPISAIQHYKLLITRQEVYEIEGTEQSFTDISGLLQFYQETPLTISSRTIGKVCPKPENYLITQVCVTIWLH